MQDEFRCLLYFLAVWLFSVLWAVHIKIVLYYMFFGYAFGIHNFTVFALIFSSPYKDLEEERIIFLTLHSLPKKRNCHQKIKCFHIIFILIIVSMNLIHWLFCPYISCKMYDVLYIFYQRKDSVKICNTFFNKMTSIFYLL